jgi:hypothetical protein
MSMSDRVTLRQYDTVLEAKNAEQMLLQGGIPADAVTRSGKKVSVAATYESQARALLAGTTTPADDVADVSSTASDTAQQVATSAQQAATSAVDTAQQAATSVVDTAQQAASTAAETVQDAASAVSSQASKVTSAAADKVRTLADTVRQQGTSPDAPAVQQQAAQTTASLLEKTSQYIQPGGIQTLLSDIRSLIRRNPTLSLVVGLGTGYAIRALYFPTQTPPSSSTALAKPSVPLVTPPPASNYSAGDVQSYSPAPASTAPLSDVDTTLGAADLDVTGMAIGDDVLDTDIASDLGPDDILTSDLGTSSTFAGDVVDADVDAFDVVDVDMTGDVMGTSSTTDDILDTDVMMTDSAIDASTTSDLGTHVGGASIGSSATTPLSLDDLETSGQGTTSDLADSGMGDLGDVAARWDARTRGEGPQE